MLDSMQGVGSAQAASPPRQTGQELATMQSGSRSVVREFLGSAQAASPPRQTGQELATMQNGSRSVVREFLKRAAMTASLCILAICSLAAGNDAFETSFRKGTEALRNSRFDEAAAAFEQCTKLMPAFPEAYFNLGLARFQQRRFDDATAALTKAVELKPQLRGAHFFLGIALYRLNNDAGAEHALRLESESDPSNAAVLMWLGITEIAEAKAAAAAADLDKAAQLKPKDVDILYHQGRAHMLLSRDIYQQMYALDPNSWRVHQVLAESFSEADRLEDAIKECGEAIRLKPEEPGLHEQLADIYWKQNHLDLAETAFEQELKIDPANTAAMYKLAVVSIERSKPGPAAKLLSEVLRRNPNSIPAHYQLGRALAQLGENEAAVPHFAAVIAQPDKAESDILRQSYYQLSQLYRRLRKPEESRKALDSFVKLKEKADSQQQEKFQDKLKRAQAAEGSENGAAVPAKPE